jgi:hypothetical protein
MMRRASGLRTKMQLQVIPTDTTTADHMQVKLM